MEITEEERAKIQEKIEKLRSSKFKQQMLPAWRPVPSFGSTMIIFGIFGIVFLTLGIALYVMSDNVIEATVAYSETTYCPPVDYANPQPCEVTFKLTEEVPSPIYVYYQLDNFYQNHRRYVKSRSYQ